MLTNSEKTKRKFLTTEVALEVFKAKILYHECDKEGMLAENAHRMRLGNGVSYGDESFETLTQDIKETIKTFQEELLEVLHS